MFNEGLYEAVASDDALIDLLYQWYRFPDRTLQRKLLDAIKKINAWYPEERTLTVYRGYRKFDTPDNAGHLLGRNSNFHSFRFLNRKVGSKTKLEIDAPASWSLNKETAFIFSVGGNKSAIIETTVNVPSKNILVFTDEIYKAILKKYHVTALIAPPMEEIVFVPDLGKKMSIEGKVILIEKNKILEW